MSMLSSMSRCYRCGASGSEARLRECRICGQVYCLGCAYLMRGDPYCSKACGYAHKFPDEGKLFIGGQPGVLPGEPSR